MQYQHLKSTYQPQLWQELGHHLDNLHRVSLSIQTTLSEVSSRLIWLSEGMSHKERVSELTQEEYVVLVQKLEVVNANKHELSHSLKNLNQQYDVVHKMVSEVEVQLFTSLYGTKKSKTSLS